MRAGPSPANIDEPSAAEGTDAPLAGLTQITAELPPLLPSRRRNPFRKRRPAPDAELTMHERARLKEAEARAGDLAAIDPDWNGPWPLDWQRCYAVLRDLAASEPDGTLPDIQPGVSKKRRDSMGVPSRWRPCSGPVAPPTLGWVGR